MVWFANAEKLQQVTRVRQDEGKEVAFLQYMKVTPPLDAVEKNLGSICVRRSTFDEMKHIVFGK